MYNGVKAMIDKEKELRPKEHKEEKKEEHKKEEHKAEEPKKAPVEEHHDKVVDHVDCGSHMKSSKELVAFPKFPAGTKSLLSKNLSKEIWAKLHEAKDKVGFTFKKAIFSGC